MAISAAAAVVGKVLDYLSEPAKTLAKQCLCANKVSKQLDKEKKELMSELDDLLNMVEQAKQRAEEIEKSVNKWINNVENLLKEVTDLERRMTATTSCLNGKCPTLERYRLCKEMMKKIKALTEFKGKSNFKPLSHPAPLPGILYRQVSQTFTYFGATKAAIDQIMDALQDDDTYTIGVHGMGGSGKTTAAIEVGREAKTLGYSVGLLNFGENDSLDSARNEVEACITRFLGSGLLTCYEEIIVGDTPEYLQVHDMFRNTGRWIAKHFEKNYNFFNVAKTLTTPIEKDILEDCFGVTSWYNDGVEKVDFLFHFDAPNLQIIALCGNFKSSPLLSFEGIKGLKVFDLSQFLNQNIVLTLPLSIKFLEDLRFLRLCNWELGDISCISSLTRLELLALNSSTINELPNDLDKLKRLKLLDLSYCRYREKNYNGAIGKCSQLEELYLNTLGSKPKEFYCQIVADIITLPKLQRFVIKYKSVQFTVSVDAVSKKKILELVDFDISKLRVSKKNLLQQAEIVVLERVHGGCPSIFPDMVGVVGAMNRLSHLHFGKCQEIECLLDTTSGFEVDLPNLVELVLYELANLKDLCRGPSIKVLRFLENLETVTIVGCCQLSTLFPRESKLKNLTHLTLIDFTGETLFSMSVAQSLQQLTELHVHKCVELKHIFASEGEGGSNEIVPISPQRSSQSTLMPKLKSFDLSKCVKLESAFPNCCVEGFAALESIIISEAPQLKLIFGELDHQNHSSHQCQSIHSHLKHLELNNLDNLIGICLEGNGARWPSLSEPLVNNCPKLTVYEEKNVENVKALLEFETSVPLQQQQILFNGNEVSNSQKLVLTMTVSSGAGAAASS
ncbi:hypothetical protein TSUD_127140 [Trifolium subterraneum]|nr:hypothetical protein TSUD_127140 [Trifolium subterraneum]